MCEIQVKISEYYCNEFLTYAGVVVDNSSSTKFQKWTVCFSIILVENIFGFIARFLQKCHEHNRN